MRWYPFALVALAGCELGTDPPPGPPRPPDAVDVTVEFCLGDTPRWIAYKNEGYDWVVIPVHFAENSFSFPATPRLTLGTATGATSNDFAFSDVVIRNLTAAEADAIRCASGNIGIRTMTGTVTTDHAENFTVMYMGASLAVVTGTRPYTLPLLRAGPLDLVAVDRGDVVSNRHSSRVIVRPNIAVTSGAAIPRLDFTSAEAKTLDTARISLDGGLLAFADVQFRTARGTLADLGFNIASTNTVALGTVPPSLRSPGDLHRVQITSFDRRIALYLSAPKDTTIAAGPDLATPTFDTVSSAPALRPRMRIGFQTDYASAMEVRYSQGSSNVFRSFAVITTAGYLGGSPGTWELEVPDLSNVEFPSTWVLSPGTQTSIAVLGWNARMTLFFGAGAPANGETLRAAVRTGGGG